MAGKPRPIIIERNEFSAVMAARMGALNLSVAQFAQQLGISRAAVYALMSGALPPSEKILKKVGLEVVYRVVMPEKAKKS